MKINLLDFEIAKEWFLDEYKRCVQKKYGTNLNDWQFRIYPDGETSVDYGSAIPMDEWKDIRPHSLSIHFTTSSDEWDNDYDIETEDVGRRFDKWYVENIEMKEY